MVFQDPYGSLDPHLSAVDIVAEPLRQRGVRSRTDRETRAAALIDRVGLPTTALRRKPAEFSGGQRQRIGIARALASEPELLVCDEATSALDVSVQAQVLDLLREIRHDTGLTYVFISHNLGVVREISDTIVVMKAGNIVESGRTAEVLANPTQPYTAALRAAALDPTTMIGIKPRDVVSRLSSTSDSTARLSRSCLMTDLDLTRPVLGTMTFGDTVDAASPAPWSMLALDAGITHIDTANGYAGGAAENASCRGAGRPPRRCHHRDQGRHPHPDAGGDSPLSAAGSAASVEASLRRLDTDHVDLFYLHQPDRAAPAGRNADHRRRTRCRRQDRRARCLQLRGLADRRDQPPRRRRRRPAPRRRPAGLQPPRPTHRGRIRRVRRSHRPGHHGLQPARRRPAHRAAHLRRKTPPKAGSATPDWPRCTRKGTGTPRYSMPSASSAPLADKAGIPMTELALRWLISKPATGPILLGGSKVSHLQNNIAAIAAGRLDDDLVAACDDVGAALRGAMPNYNR